VLWRHLVNACEVTALLIGCWQNLGAVCFWQPIPGLNLVRVLSLLPCVADVYRVFYVRLSGCLNYIKGNTIIIIILGPTSTKPHAEILKLNNVNGCNGISFGDHSILEGDRIYYYYYYYSNGGHGEQSQRPKGK